MTMMSQGKGRGDGEREEVSTSVFEDPDKSLPADEIRRQGAGS